MRGWRRELAAIRPNDLSQAATPLRSATDGALSKLEAELLARVIKHGRQADRSDIDAFVWAVRALHHPAGAGFLRDVAATSDDWTSPFAEPSGDSTLPAEKWADNVGGTWGEARFHAAVGLAELGEHMGVGWLLEHARPNSFGIDGNLRRFSHHRAPGGSLRESCRDSLIDLFGLERDAEFDELTGWWAANRSRFTPRPVALSGQP